MLHCELNVQIDEPLPGYIDEDWLKRVVDETLTASGGTSSIELGLVITSDQVVRELNQTYRGVDETTDVLSFAFSQPEKCDAESFIVPPDNVLHLGEVIISYPQATRQAKEQRHSLEQEVALLVIHGVLHLLGYDDEHPEGEQRMRLMEAKVLGQFVGGGMVVRKEVI